jgi:oligopeptidase A
MRQLAFGKLDLELHMHHATDEGADLDKLARSILKGYIMELKNRAANNGASLRPPLQQPRRLTPLATTATNGPKCWMPMPSPASSRKACSILPWAASFRGHDPQQKANSEDPAKLFQNFMGRDPDAMALLVRAGLA